MKTFIERKLEVIRKIGYMRGLTLSCDIYYNDLAVDKGEQFVVRLRSANIIKKVHFRSNHIRKSLKMALKWLKENHK